MAQQLKINNFDLLRIIAASQVLVGHTIWHLRIPTPHWMPLLDAFPGVPMFFSISGFLISASFERNSDVRSYAHNRLLRIYPGLWSCIVVTILAAGICGISFLNLQAPIWFLSQLAGGIYTPQFLRAFGFGSYNGSLWTIPIELQFYVLLPVVYVFAKRQKYATGYFVAIWLAFVGVALVTQMMFNPLVEYPHEGLLRKLYRYSFAPHIYLFLTGVLLQRLAAHKSRWISGKGAYWLLGYLAFYWLLPRSAPTIVAAMVLLAVTTVSVAYTAPKISHAVLRGNDVSYGVYIYHGLLINVFIELGFFGQWKDLAVLAGCTYVIAYLSWTGVERRFLRRKTHALAPVQ
ncbi:MAG: acyltransferase family protein [Terriglobales bacterium]